MGSILIESDDGDLPSASAVLQVRATNAEYNQPALRIDQVSDSGGAASIRIFDPNPDIEFVESGAADAAGPARGKYEIAVQSDELQINGRKEDNSGFDPIMVFQRAGGGRGRRERRLPDGQPVRRWPGCHCDRECHRRPIGQSWWRRRPLCRGWALALKRLLVGRHHNGTGDAATTRVDQELQVMHRKGRVQRSTQSTYEQSYW
jgi:hypothetical protein